jgi:hypothetical protein
MRIEELSIGDWVRVDGTPTKVWYLSEDSEVNDTKNDWVEPIPLTAEILEKNGFEENCGRWYNSEALMEFEQYKCGWCRTINCGEYSVYFIKYVHQLQRAMKLEGTEKEIIL